MKWLLSLMLCGLSVTAAANEPITEDEAFAFEIFKTLIETDTTPSNNKTLEAVRTLADRLLAEGFPAEDVDVIEYGGKGNLVARLRSAAPTAKPVLLMAHIDVVEADPADWSMDPKRLNEDDDFYYGRGTLDDKDEVAIHMTNLIRLHRARVPLRRDVIVAITADEEGGDHNGASYLVEHHRDLVDAAFVINEGGGGLIAHGNYVANAVQAAEKVYQSYHLEVTNSGGHSSLPRADNAIYELASALKRIEAFDFPVMLNETTRAYFSGRAAIEKGEIDGHFDGLLATPPNQASVDYFRDVPAINARLRTTCVATELKAGHAENALPQRARATVNCRVFPGVPVEEVRQTLLEVAAIDGMTITPIREALQSDASPLTDEIMGPIKTITAAMWPGAKVMPIMSTGATDALFFRNAGIPVYGVSGIFTDSSDNRAHGRDERIRKSSFYEGLEFLYRLTRAVAAADTAAGATSL